MEEYAKHTALNFGQALQGIRYVHSHPRADRIAPPGSARHLRLSVAMRLKLIANDLFFATIPPHWHHSAEELEGMTKVSIGRWFQYGYCAWRFDETGAPKADLAGVDRRWDPRCDDA
jgi:hypothetical protein